MKASEIIKLLQSRINDFGDCEVTTYSNFDNVGVNVEEKITFYFYRTKSNEL